MGLAATFLAGSLVLVAGLAELKRPDSPKLLAQSPKNGVNYLVAVQTPQYKIDSIDALQSTPVVLGSMSAP